MRRHLVYSSESGVVKISSLYYRDTIMDKLIFRYFDILMHDLDVGAVVIATLGGIGFISLIVVGIIQVLVA